MEMAADLAGAGFGGRCVTEGEGAHRRLAGDAAAQIRRRLGIVVAGDPDPVRRPGEMPQAFGLGRAEAAAGAPVVEAVAEGEDRCRAAGPPGPFPSGRGTGRER